MGIGVFARKVPLSFLKREPSLVEGGLAVRGSAFTEANGIVSTLVEADTNFGDEIWLGLIRLRVEPPSANLVVEGDFMRAAVAASARLCTSSASIVGSTCVADAVGVADVTATVSSCSEGLRERAS